MQHHIILKNVSNPDQPLEIIGSGSDYNEAAYGARQYLDNLLAFPPSETVWHNLQFQPLEFQLNSESMQVEYCKAPERGYERARYKECPLPQGLAVMVKEPSGYSGIYFPHDSNQGHLIHLRKNWWHSPVNSETPFKEIEKHLHHVPVISGHLQHNRESGFFITEDVKGLRKKTPLAKDVHSLYSLTKISYNKEVL